MNLEEAVMLYKDNDTNKHMNIYKLFKSNAEKYQNGILVRQFNSCLGCGEIPFSWHWYLLVNDMPSDFKFLEIGVYKGRVLALIKLLSTLLNKNANIWGITPLSNASDKYSNYENIDYLNAIKSSFTNSNVNSDNVQLIQGFSQNNDVINSAKEKMLYDIIFIDGCHDYEIVCQDIKNYSQMIKSGGYLVMDDASLYLKDAYGLFLGHPDVGKAILDNLDNNPEFVHLYAVGHNRVWRKV